MANAISRLAGGGPQWLATIRQATHSSLRRRREVIRLGEGKSDGWSQRCRFRIFSPWKRYNNPRNSYTSKNNIIRQCLDSETHHWNWMNDYQVEAGPIFSGHWIPYLFFRTSPDIIGYSRCPDFSGHVRRPTQLPKLTRLLTSAISVAI